MVVVSFRFSDTPLYFTNVFICCTDDPEFQQWVQPLISRLIPILLHPKAPRSLHENAAVSIGRIGLMHPNFVAPHLHEFAQAWCQALYEIRDDEEKDSAFRGLCTLVLTNPAGMAKVCLFVQVHLYDHQDLICAFSSCRAYCGSVTPSFAGINLHQS